MKLPKDTKPFPTRVEKLCHKYLPTFVRYPQIEMGGRVNLAGLNRLRSIHSNKEGLCRQKTQKQGGYELEQQDVNESPHHPPLKFEEAILKP